MSEIAAINTAATITPTLPKAGRLMLAPVSMPEVDQLDLSAVGEILAKLPGSTPARAEKIAQIQRDIQAGTYETPERINATVDRLVAALGLD